jgi:hypothetical protein
MKKIILGFLLASGLFALLSYRLIITDKGIELERKEELGFQHTYINTKGWSIDDYARNPEIAAILAKRRLKKVLNPEEDISKKVSETSK